MYGTILADPPWPESGGVKIKRGADRHYPLMKVEAIKALQVNGAHVSELALPDSHLYLWATNNYLMAAGEVMKAWGYRYVTAITWAKTGKPGLGQYFRGRTEHLLFGVRGKVPYRTLPSGKRAQGTTLVTQPRGKHSEKPEMFHDLIEMVSPGRYIELFARRRPTGVRSLFWSVWGNEVTPQLLPDLKVDISPLTPAAPGGLT
jgi:N6-adenosine-specific RNA methylase IME4